ncbi:Spermidine/putrescine import ATP-binding protein PotA [Fusobacterium sp. DD29]|uniref:ABC transporter ATP-binding protein n=1 Tax=unclassified Fusobacterium TaxID=2648384 RepID=UPI001B8BD361|nr:MULTISPECIES: ABC transporter ATP-binding protein [unclassified Fusobacterium]MBR8701431.1 Spermidine/putrescine import ATP-binding protein PotA [Fusobacterium sp. DD45]MBR8711183.1 Spermidine/putrescine import ATP-binding protein PotA [Fusobacterium sp. DD28]MBR8749654.1 Spermidine/putrescine import ATP-binding protein PotA [Fusobacterium sp. DD29]MBR8751757.1 Spermidine/putrescine import ATP-binding protein PotA [Fusobacterium sp. DD26]MBR8761915.1 Spermidine/putrescine import ATP-binding
MGAKGVKFENINKIFLTEDNRRVAAVTNLNLDIKPGEFICLLGPSGCGKTTILRMLAGFEVPTDGHIYIGDENVEKITPDKRDTAMVFQNYALFPHMNVYDNIAYGLKLQKLDKKEIDERVSKILKLMNMEGFAQRVPSQMSGGQQQRVSLARALVMEPGVLLFDEPLSNLDAKLRLHMRDEIRKIQQEVFITSIYVTHDQAEAMGLADRVIIMKDGKMEQAGSPIEIYQHPVNEFVANFIGRANIFNGKLIEKNDFSCVIDINGVTYDIEQKVAHNVGDNIKIVVRPESIIVGENDFKGKVTKSMFMGAYHEYEITFGDMTVEISVSNPKGKKNYKLGDELTFSLDKNSIHIL